MTFVHNKKIAHVETYMHVICWGVSLILTIIAAAADVMSPVGVWYVGRLCLTGLILMFIYKVLGIQTGLAIGALLYYNVFLLYCWCYHVG